MAAELPDLRDVEGHTFSYKQQEFTVATATANQSKLDELTRGASAPVDMHFTVTSPNRSEPIGVHLRLSAENAADLELVCSELEDAVQKIVDGHLPRGTHQYL